MKSFILFFITIVFSSCTSAPPPEWAANIQSIYPQETYLAEKGIGKTAGEAEAAASRAISQYISTQVTVQLREEARLITGGPARVEIEEITIVASDLELLAMRYTQAWYNRHNSQWETVAYINREEAFVLIEPQLRREKETFLNMYTSAEAERDPVRRFAIYRGAQNYYAQNFGRQRAIATRISPAMAEEYFSDVNRIIAQLPQKIDNARHQAVIFVDCTNDYQNFIKQAFERMFGNESFRLTQNRREASAVFAVRINWNEATRSQLGGTVFDFNPVLSSSLTGASGILFSYNTQEIPRTTTATRDAGIRRAAISLTAEIEKTFPDEFRRRLASFAGE